MAEKKKTSKAFRDAARERQKRYRDKISTGEFKRVQLVLDQEVGIKIGNFSLSTGTRQTDQLG